MTLRLSYAFLALSWGCGEGPPADSGPPTIETVVQADTGFYQALSWAPDGSKLLLSVLDWGVGPSGFTSRVYEIESDGSGFGPVTDGPRDGWTSWSPDGSRVAFAAVRGENLDIYTADADGTNRNRLTDDPAEDTHPQWSLDGSRIVFVSYRGGRPEIYAMNADGSDPAELGDTEGEPGNPVWSPGGDRLVFYETGPDGADHVWVMNGDGTGRQRLTAGLWPAWSPDGSKILYGAPDGLYTIHPDGTNPLLLVPGDVEFGRFSPDGSRIAYITVDSGQVSVHVANADGSGASTLLRRPMPSW
jgi:Tol biopolymer transport system component